ncbi:MAG: pyridoxal phosphate-dependent aminotransferase [Bacteroidales bacterium]|nr:pyridoxal phosphate-dependent aminotransferase [Bacteroidales bacterium]MBP5374227.1 pyridoxal phosphate-dependent aminotransferase [Bacteroidales bacterium]
MPQISTRGLEMPSSPIRKLAPLADAARREGVKVYHLNIGQPDLPTPEKALDAVRHIERKTLEYSPSEGFLSLRTKLCGYYKGFGIDVSEDDIIITAGGSEAILLSFLACMNPGDEMIMVEPGYANYISFAVTAGIRVRTVQSRIEDGFALPPSEAFEEVITPRTRAILLCNPGNPTGVVYSPAELQKIKELVRKYDLYLFSDEVYREFVYTDEPYLSALSLGLDEQAILIDSVSKRYSECGIRIGMIVTHNRLVRDTVMKYCQARLSPPLLGQIVAEASIEGTEKYLADSYREYKERRDFFIKGLNSIPGVFSPMPHGAFYTVASLPVADAEDFCRWCLTDFRLDGETVMMAPAAGFYRNPDLGRNQVRLAYVLKKEDLQRSLMLLRAALKAYNRR